MLAAMLPAFAAAALGFSSPVGAYSIEAPLPTDSASAPAAPTTAVPTPTTHSYDDAHTEQKPAGSSLVLWILAGAAIGFGVIVALLIRAGPSPRHEIPRRTEDIKQTGA